MLSEKWLVGRSRNVHGNSGRLGITSPDFSKKLTGTNWILKKVHKATFEDLSITLLCHIKLKSVCWKDRMKLMFEELKMKLTSSSMMAFPGLKQAFVLYDGSSLIAVRALSFKKTRSYIQSSWHFTL